LKVFVTGATGYIGFNTAKNSEQTGILFTGLQEVKVKKINYTEKKLFRLSEICQI